MCVDPSNVSQPEQEAFSALVHGGLPQGELRDFLHSIFHTLASGNGICVGFVPGEEENSGPPLGPPPSAVLPGIYPPGSLN